jgi:hypothetical protein
MGKLFEAVKVHVALVGLKSDLVQRVLTRMTERRNGDVGLVVVVMYDDLALCRSALDDGEINAVCLNAAEFAPAQLEDFLGSVRFKYPLVSLCLVGPHSHLEKLPGFRDSAKARLSHYFRLREDADSLEDEIGVVRDLLVADQVKSSALGHYETTPGRMRSTVHDYDVFLSYANKDVSTALLLYDKIRAAGYRVYMTPKVDKREDSAWEEVRLALRGAQELWLLLSPDSQGNEWVTTEWGTAWSWKIPTCIFLYRCSRDAIPERLLGENCFDVHQCDDAIKARLGHLPKLQSSA